MKTLYFLLLGLMLGASPAFAGIDSFAIKEIGEGFVTFRGEGNLTNLCCQKRMQLYLQRWDAGKWIEVQRFTASGGFGCGNVSVQEDYRNNGLKPFTEYSFRLVYESQALFCSNDTVFSAEIKVRTKSLIPPDFNVKKTGENTVKVEITPKSAITNEVNFYIDGKASTVPVGGEITLSPTKHLFEAKPVYQRIEGGIFSFFEIDLFITPPSVPSYVLNENQTITLNWINNSKISSQVKILQNGKIIALPPNRSTFYTIPYFTEINEPLCLAAFAEYEGSDYYSQQSCLDAKFPPNSVSNFHVENREKNSLKLVWRNNSSIADSIRILRNNMLIKILSKNDTSYIDRGLAANTTYNYCVIPYDLETRMVAIATCNSFSTIQAGLSASDATNDSYIRVNWDIPATCLLNNANQSVYLGLKEMPSGKLLHEVVMDSVSRILERERYHPAHALLMNGPYHVVKLPAVNLPQSGWSAELWFRADALPSVQSTLLSDLNGNPLINLDHEGMLKAGTNLLSSSAIKTGQWYLLSLVFDGTGLQAYINGRSAEKIAQYAGQNIKFGDLGNNGAQNQAFSGYLGEFRLWREARTEYEIHQNRFLTYRTPLPSTLIAAWVFDQIGNSTIIDKTGRYTATTIGGYITTHQLASISDTQLSGSFFHYVGPGQSRKYKLELYSFGEGETLCSNINYEAQGSTLDIQKDTLKAGDHQFPHQVRLAVKQVPGSALPEVYQFYRVNGKDTLNLGSIPATADSLVFYDRFAFDGPKSLKNGATYQYLVRAQSFRFKKLYAAVADSGSTAPINFKAVVATTQNQISLSWNELSRYADALTVSRDGSTLANLLASTSRFVDLAPIPGKQHIYELTLIKNRVNLIAVKDTGEVVPNGRISGRVLTASGDYGVPGTKISLKPSIAGAASREVLTDSTGYFAFDAVYYDQQAVFTLEASKANHLFSPASRIDINLNLEKARQDGLLFRTTKSYTQKLDPLPALSQFSVAPLAGQNGLNLSWFYQPDPKRKPTLFKIYRDKELLTIVQDRTQFQDTLAQPGSKPKYQLFAYTLWRDTIREDTLEQQLLVPKLLAPQPFTATADPNLGTVNLQWTYTASSGYSGFVILRDNQEIARVSRDPRSYTDLGGVPGRNHSYQIEAFWNKFDTLFHSDTLDAFCIYPKLPEPTSLFSKTEDVFILLDWTQRASPTYNFDGWVVLRGTDQRAIFDTLGFIPKGAQLKFLDVTGIPKQRYFYQVCSYAANRLGSIRLSDRAVLAQRLYPALAPPLLNASNDLIGKVELKWEAPVGLFGGYLLFRNGTLLQRLSSTRLSYTDYWNAITKDTSANYTIITYDVRKGKEVQSDFSKVAVGKAIHEVQTSLPPAPTNFSASREYPSQIQLSWTYPKYILADFELFRDGKKIATLESNLRSYKDFEPRLIPGKVYEYSILAVRNGKASNRTRAAGELNSVKTALGSVRYAPSGKGIRNALVSLQGPTGWYHMQSDSNGVFRFENLIDTIGAEMTLKVRTPDQLYDQTTTFKIEPNQLTYVFDIEVMGGAAETTPDKIAQPYQLSYRADYVNNLVQFNWALKPGKYDSCVIYRGPMDIGHIKKGAALSFIDSTATPGVAFLYRVETRYQQDTASSDLVFVENPILLPVRALDAQPVPALDEVFLTFNHQTNVVDYYQIERNNELIGIVNPSQALCFADTTGLPGRLYNYTVTAVRGKQISPAVSVRDVFFPKVNKVDGLISTSKGNGIQLDWTHRSLRCRGFNVYRDSTFIDTVMGRNFQYTDYGVIPESEPLLGVSAFYIAEDGKTYESDINYVQVKVAALVAPLVTATAKGNLNAVKISWKWIPLNDTIGSERIVVYRKSAQGAKDSINLYEAPIQSLDSLLDNSGIPNKEYRYCVKVIGTRNGKEYFTKSTEVIATFPPVAPPVNFTATNGKEEFIGLEWKYQNANVDGFKIFRFAESGNENYFLNANQRKFVNDPSPLKAFAYSLTAKRVVEGISYWSDSVYVGARANVISGNVINAFSASDGTSKIQVVLEWKAAADLGTATGFAIYRAKGLSGDFKPLDNLSPDKRIYRDAEAEPGVFYVYYVAATDAKGESIDRASDSGFRSGEGLINGKVLSKTGAPLAGVNLIAEGDVDGETIKQEVTTNSRGDFNFSGLFVGDATSYKVYPRYLDHSFLPKQQIVELTKDIPNQSLNVFLDQDGFSLHGKASYAIGGCPIPDLKILLKRYYETNTKPVQDTITTEADGTFNRILDINEQFLTKVVLVPLALRNVKIDDISRTTEHDFVVDSVSFTKQDLLGFKDEKRVEILDQKFYQLALEVTNACGDELGENQFIVNVKSKNACFSKNFTTTTTGKFKVELPPLDYFVTVTGVKELRPESIPIVEYFKVRPIELRMDTAHAYRDIKQKIKTDSIFTISMQYHTIPKVEVNGFLVRCENRDVKIIKSNNTVDLDIQVKENFGNGSSCTISKGSVRVINPAAAKNTDVLYDLSEVKNGVLKHSFQGGAPALTDPYLHTLYVEYYDESGAYLASSVASIMVEGSKALDGFDVIVDPLDKEGGSVQIPLYVLRDPPGDQSYAFVKKGTKVAYEISAGKKDGGGGGVAGETEVKLFGIGFKLEAEAKVGASKSNTNAFTYSIENTEQYSTAEASVLGQDGEYVDGKDADVVVGMGLAQQFGINYQLTANQKTCVATLKQEVGLTNVSAKTTWSYTFNQINDLLIPELKTTRDKIKAGTLKLTGKSNSGTAKDTVFYNNLIRNWEKVLHYYDYETVPFCYICEKGYLEQYTLPSWIKTKLNGSISGFCNKLKQRTGKVTTSDDFCEKAKKVFWDSELIDAYNLASKDFELGLEYLSTNGLEGNVQSILKNSSGVFNTLGPNQIQNIFDASFGVFGPEAKNITFGGNTKFETELAVARSKNLNFEFESVFNTTFGVSPLKNSTSVTASTGTSIGLGVAATIELSTEIVSTENVITVNGYVDVSRTTAGSASNEINQSIGYVLSDDDDGDQFSVTVIRGLAPNHTPYFQLLGGRSSCPLEEGTIDRDGSRISLEKPDGSPDDRNKRVVDPNGEANFSLALSNLNPFNEDRSFRLEFDPESNPYGAIIRVNGEEPSANLSFSPPPIGVKGKSYANISISRAAGSGFYQFEDIKVCLVPDCYEGSNIKEPEQSCVLLSTTFESPCSNVSIVEPGNNWLINNNNELQIKIVDYDLSNEKLKGVKIQYRRKGTEATSINDNFGWRTIDSISVDALKVYFEKFRLVYPKPTYNYVWNTADQLSGEYEIRVLADCQANGTTFSNVVRGKIARGKLYVFGKPEPGDGILSLGENIQVQFNKSLDQGRKDQMVLVVVHVGKEDTLQFVSSGIKGTKLNIDIPEDVLDALDNQHLKILVDKVYDEDGNTLSQPVVWSFLVIRNPIYWSPTEYSLRLHKGGLYKIPTYVYNASQDNQVFKVSLSQTQTNTWLKPDISSFQIDNQGYTVPFSIDTRNMVLDSMYQDTVFAEVRTLTGDKFNKKPYFIFKVEVEATPPAWDSLYHVQKFGPGLPMLLDVNWRFSDEADLSEDTLDLISVWRGNEIRGLASIRKIGTHYTAAIQVSTADDDQLGAPLEFRIWDASTDTEYTAYGDSTLHLHPGQIIGSVTSPFIVRVDRTKDRARYIPLYSADFTWFSLNSKEPNMHVDNILRELKPSLGDFISNRKVKAVYNGTTWVPSDSYLQAGDTLRMDTMNVTDGYMIYLRDKKEQAIRVTGSDVRPESKKVQKGWNFIGYSTQSPVLIRDSRLNTIQNIKDGDRISSNFSRLDNKKQSNTEYQSGWVDTTFQLKPNRAYMLFMQNAGQILRSETTEGRPLHLADLEEWQWAPDQFPEQMLTYVTIENLPIGALEDWALGIFDGNECRGLATLINASDANRWLLQVSGDRKTNKLDLRLRNRRTGQEYRIRENLDFLGENLDYDWYNPLPLHLGAAIKRKPIIENKLASRTETLKNTALEVYPNPFHDVLQVALKAPQGTYLLLLRNIDGKRVAIQKWESQNDNGKDNLSWPLENLPAGMYYLELLDKNEELVQRQKLVKTH